MSKQEIVIIDYGAGNVKSLSFAIERLGFRPKLSSDASEIESADKVFFPGVGAAPYAMNSLRNSGLEQVIPNLKQPVLGICLGMQLMCKSSEEGDTKGLGIIDEPIVAFSSDLKIPQIGWNRIKDLKGPLFQDLKEEDFMYFVHSFYLPKNKYSIANAEYGVSYSAAFQKDNFYGVQFHPEKSSKIGSQILSNFLNLK